jgi:hypothetical protein
MMTHFELIIVYCKSCTKLWQIFYYLKLSSTAPTPREAHRGVARVNGEYLHAQLCAKYKIGLPLLLLFYSIICNHQVNLCIS